jgi:V/A-type H+-transporting ATPase subunit I
MAILPMKRIEILAMLSDSKAIMDIIQQQGQVEITDCNESDDGLYKLSTSTAVGQFSKFRDVAASALDVLSKYAPEKTGLLAGFEPRPEMTVSEFLSESRTTDETLSKCYTINSLYKEIQDCSAEIVKAQTGIRSVLPWAALNVPSSFRGTKQTAVFIGSIRKLYDRDGLLAALAEKAPETDFDCEIISSDKIQTCILCICHKDDAQTLETALAEIGFAYPADPTRHPPEHRLHRLENIITQSKAEIAECEEKIKTYADERGKIKFIIDCFTLRIDKYDALDKIAMSDNIFVLTGFIPEEYAKPLSDRIEQHFDAAITITDTDTEAEDVPVALSENGFGRMMEPITEMYSTPSHSDIDPNPFMSFFYFMMFGLMLGDAGYGLVMVIACLIVKIKFRSEPKKASTVNYGLCCGLGTVFWGALLNGWFGDLPSYIAGGLTHKATDFITADHLYWFNPLSYTMEFLLLCLVIGIFHLSYGLILNIVKQFRAHQPLEAILNNVPVILILFGTLPLINSQIGGTTLRDNPHTTFIYNFIVSNSHVLYLLLEIGAALVVLTPVILAIKDKKSVLKIAGGFGAGLYGLYNTASGCLGDILSYARLLALGLCTGVIASVINQLAAMPGNPVVFVIIALVAHPVNIAINLIGAYVHSNRLEYVEFFSKFYDGGGTAFRPLSVNSKSFRFKEETRS